MRATASRIDLIYSGFALTKAYPSCCKRRILDSIDDASPRFGICGFKDSGKTTLIEGLIPRLIQKGLSVAVVKHDSHGIDVDRPGKDSDRFYRAGADVVLQGPGEVVLRRHGEGSIEKLLCRLVPRYDIVLVEGHKETPLPKVWLKGKGGEERPENVKDVLIELPWGEGREDAVMKRLEERLLSQYGKTPLYGLALIGGKSRRMGRPKHLIETSGETWIEKVVKTIGAATKTVSIAGAGEIPEGLKGFVLLHDIPEAEGPMSGILSAMRWHPEASWLAAACDMPEVSASALEWLLGQRKPGTWIVMPEVRGGAKEVQPLLAWYDFRAHTLLEEAARTRDFSLHRLAAHTKVKTPRPLKKIRGAWKNINTLDDLQNLEDRLNSNP